jgi:DNA-binding HxlR family transcriptional regulator
MTVRRKQEGTSLIPGNLHVPEDCRAVSEVLSRVGDKWTILVVGELGNGPKRSTKSAARSAAFRSGC